MLLQWQAITKTSLRLTIPSIWYQSSSSVVELLAQIILSLDCENTWISC